LNLAPSVTAPSGPAQPEIAGRQRSLDDDHFRRLREGAARSNLNHHVFQQRIAIADHLLGELNPISRLAETVDAVAGADHVLLWIYPQIIEIQKFFLSSQDRNASHASANPNALINA
jgi:hypothetical protein